MSTHEQSRDESVQAFEQLARSMQAAIETLAHDLIVAHAMLDDLRSTKTVASVAANAGMSIVRARLTMQSSNSSRCEDRLAAGSFEHSTASTDVA